MTTPTSHRLRREARLLRLNADAIWRISEDLLERATAMKQAASAMDARAEALDDLAHTERVAGTTIHAQRRGGAA